MAFITDIFPLQISIGSTSMPMRSTRVAIASSGLEQRQAIWDESLRKYDISTGIRQLSDTYDLLELWEVAEGRLNHFRFRDWADYKTVEPLGTVTNIDETIGVGDDVEVDFNLTKTYFGTATSYTRRIRKPDASSVLVALDGIDQPSGWTVDETTGILTFDTPPSYGEVVSWGGEFYVPVRFDSEDFEQNIAEWQHGIINPLMLREIKETD